MRRYHLKLIMRRNKVPTNQHVSSSCNLPAIRLLTLLLLLSKTFCCALPSAPEFSDQKRSNIILFMTDDQDVTANSLDYMPRLNKLFREEGMEFLHYYVPTGLCCPSRASILRGQYCHNTKVYDNGNLNNATYLSGGWEKYIAQGLEDETVATLMQKAGYETVLIGKYLNNYAGPKAAAHKPPGFDHWMGMLRLSFYGPTFSDNGKLLKLNDTVYQTDFIRDWAVDFIRNKRNKSKPFFLIMTPFAPHAPATPAKRHEHMFPGIKFPRYDSFNPSNDVQMHRPAWMKDLPPLTEEQIDNMDTFYQKRLQSLQAIDEALEAVVDALKSEGIDDNTYMIYTADNGQHFGDFRIPAGKRQAYETDVLVPFLIRGPSVPQRASVTEVVQSVDLAPTFLDLAKPESPDKIEPESYTMDGKSIVPLLHEGIPIAPKTNNFRFAALLEGYFGSSNIGLRYKNMTFAHGFYYKNHFYPNTYQAVRLANAPKWFAGDATADNLLYVEWCTGERELYNMTNDPHQIKNIVLDADLELQMRLYHLVGKLGNCKGEECYNIDDLTFTEPHVAQSKRRIEIAESLREAIRARLPCHNPPNMSVSATSPSNHELNGPTHPNFEEGFPFSDGDFVADEILLLWEENQQKYHH